MKKLLLLGSLLAAGAIGLQDVSVGHGGTYRGPGDTVPPGGGGGGGGGGPSTPGPSGPSAPGPSGPSTPGPAGPGAPGSGRPSGPSTAGGGGGPDLTLWQFWWGFNKDPYLNLKSHIHSDGATTGSDDFFLGHGQKTQAKDSMRPSEETIRGVIVPALQKSLASETQNDIVTGAMIALAKIGDAQSEDGTSEFEQLILPFLTDASQEIAETAAVALGILGNPKSISTLKALLLDDATGRKLVKSEAGVNYRTRAFAAYGLGQIGHYTEDQNSRQEIVDILWEVCQSPKGRTRDIKVAAVIAMGLVPLDLAVEGAELDPEYMGAPRTRQEQIEYLLGFFLAEKDKDKHYLTRAHAPGSICKLMEGISDKTVKDRVVEALAPYVTKRGNVGVRELRQSASLAFGAIGDLDSDPADKIIREHLLDSTGNADAQIKNFSVIALGQLGGRPGGPDGQMEGAKDLRKYLMKTLSSGKTQVKPWAGLAIGVMERGLVDSNQTPSASSLAALRSALSGTKTKIEVGAYAIACGIAGDTDSEKILIEKLDSMSDDDVRGHLAIGLGLMNSGAAIEPIQQMVEKSKYRGELLKQAAISLGLLGDKALVGNLVTMLAQAKTLTTQAAIASALGFIGDARSVDPLVEMLHDQSMTAAARGFAAVALGIVADKELLPWNAKFSVNINYRANTPTLTGEGAGLLDIL
ncbi:MAG: HEAT repeat protein [Candidatus Paceibacteria bacterium]|jgi:HEAT repeat protein